MHRCGTSSSSYGAAMLCSCPGPATAIYPGGGRGGTSAFTILFDTKPPADYYQYPSSDATTTTDPSYTYYSSSASSCSSPVDCTLSLGTASTRHNGRRAANTSCRAGFYEDIFPSSSNKLSAPSPQPTSNARPATAAAGGCSNSLNSNADPLLGRRCANCDTTSTPLWRNGPRGPKSLCNACGIRYKKEERRAAATADHHVAPVATTPSAHHQLPGHGGTGAYHNDGSNPWGFTSAKHSNSPSSISLSSSNGDYLGSSSNSDNSDALLPTYLSWCLNVPAPHLPRADYLHHY